VRKTAPRYKLTMVSIYSFRTGRRTVFAHLPVDEDGKVRFDCSELTKELDVGETFSVGY